ncbi:MAG TPA: hypothetical protein VMM59_10415 [Thermohalobaculum sp.]|nr:hypothetical protein [Thermohalobaculum sp.]
MTTPLIFLVLLLAIVVLMNWRVLASRLGWRMRACDWHRVHKRDRDDRRAWFCPACGREELVPGKRPPADCGARLGH